MPKSTQAKKEQNKNTTPTTNLPSPKTANKRQKQRFNWWWLILGIICIAAIVTAFVVNSSVSDKSVRNLVNEIAVDNSDLKVDWGRYQISEIELSESVNISQSGTYHVTGSLSNGSITVDAGVGEVKLILDNVSIENTSGPAIICYNAENFVIESVGENTLKDGATYDSGYDDDVEGVIYSRADLAFTGEGSIAIQSEHSDGIVGKDDVVFRSGSYQLTTKDDAIRGKDSVYLAGGNFTITSTGNAILSTNETDFGKGFVLVENSNLDIKTDAKGLKSTNYIVVSSGNLEIESFDDAIHSNNYVGVTSGGIKILSGDDGIHADNELIIDGGTIDIAKSYEGLEAQVVTLNDGSVSITANDDGVNAGGGADNSSQNRPGANTFKVDESSFLTVNGGNLYINSAGDGVDSNGYLIFNGGYTVVDGPTNNGNGALDAGAGITIQGGTVLAVGSSGMAESLGAKSNVCNLSLFFSTTQGAGTKIEVKDSSGNVVASHTAAKTFSHLAFGSDSLILGETYKVYLDDAEYTTFTILEVTTTIGNAKANPNNAIPKR